MAMIKFWRGNVAPASRDADTLYFVKDTGHLYLGNNLIADVTGDYAGAITEALKAYYTKTEVYTKEEINSIIAGLDAEINSGDGKLVKVSISEVDGKLTAVAVDDAALNTKLSGQDELIAGLRKDLDEITEVGGEPNKVDDVTVDGVSVVEGKVAKIDLSGKVDTSVYNAYVDAHKGDYTNAQIDAAIDADVKVVTDLLANSYSTKAQADALYDAKGAAAAVEEQLGNYMTNAAHSTFVSENAVLQSGITAEKVGQYDTVKNIVDTFFADEGSVNDAYDTLKEIAAYLAGDGSDAGDIASRLGIAETDIDSLQAKVDTEGNVQAAIDAALEAAKDYADDIDTGVMSVVAGDKNGEIKVDETTITVYDDSELAGKVGTLEEKVDVEKVSTAIANAIAAEQLGTMAKEAAADYVKKTDAPGYNDIMTKTAHETFVSGNAVLQSGITAAKVSEYNTTKTTVDTNKETWDKAGTAVQPAAIADMLTKTEAGNTYAKASDVATLSDKVDVEKVSTAIKAVQGNTDNTVEQCVNAINTMNNQVGSTMGEVQNIVSMLTWIEG